jgi:multiple sugar transport system permease protein
MTKHRAIRTLRRLPARAGLHAILVLGGIVFSLPFMWLISTSLKTKDEIFRVPMTWIPDAARHWPPEWDLLLQNFINAANFVPFFTWLGNTLQVTLLCVALNTFASALVAHGFSRIRWRGRDGVFVLVLATLMLPAQVTMIPQFLIFNSLGWYNRLEPLWAPAVFGTAFHIFLLRQFMLTLPRELDEAAKIDGCGNLRIFTTFTSPGVSRHPLQRGTLGCPLAQSHPALR